MGSRDGKISKNLMGWKGKYFSGGGLLVLIKSTSLNLSMFYMSLFSIPRSVVHILDKVSRNFLWDDVDDGHIYHVVNYDIVRLPNSKCGFGLGICGV